MMFARVSVQPVGACRAAFLTQIMHPRLRPPTLPS